MWASAAHQPRPCAAAIRSIHFLDDAYHSSLLFVRVSNRESDGAWLRDDSLRAIAELRGILIGSNAKCVGHIIAVERCDPMRPRITEPRVEHGKSSHDRRSRRKRRQH